MRADRWRYPRAALRRLTLLPGVGRVIAWPANRLFARHFTADLRLLNDVLNRTEMAGRYWVWRGMLLGWAREGRLLAHDRDADFALLPDDLPRLIAALPRLRDAGFEPRARWRSNDGRLVEIMLRRHAGGFDFYVLEPIDGMLRYFVFGWPPDQLIQVEARIPDQPLASFEFLGRTWLRHEDVDGELTAVYGDWRTSQRGWNYLFDDLAIVDRRPWTHTDTSWPPDARWRQD